jgi:hypothetical protein
MRELHLGTVAWGSKVMLRGCQVMLGIRLPTMMAVTLSKAGSLEFSHSLATVTAEPTSTSNPTPTAPGPT